MAVLANLLSHELLHVATAVRTADDELGARSQMFHFVVALDLLTAEVTVDRTTGTVVLQMLVEKPALELGPAAIAARYRIELALLCVTLHDMRRTTALNRQRQNDNENESNNDSQIITKVLSFGYGYAELGLRSLLI